MGRVLLRRGVDESRRASDRARFARGAGEKPRAVRRAGVAKWGRHSCLPIRQTGMSAPRLRPQEFGPYRVADQEAAAREAKAAACKLEKAQIEQPRKGLAAKL